MNMTLVEPIKKGGRYTKKRQEERKLQVYQLHFEEDKSAVEIAEILNFNRNTINADIQFWYCQLVNQSNGLNVRAKIVKQIQRIEIQRDRFLDYIEETETLGDKIKLEKLISDLDNRLTQFFSKVIFSGKEKLGPSVKLEENKEEEIKEFVRNLILSNKDSTSGNIYSEEALILEFLKKTKCDVLDAEGAFILMQDYGLDFCEEEGDSSNDDEAQSSGGYNLEEFAKLRGYLSDKEIFDLKNQK